MHYPYDMSDSQRIIARALRNVTKGISYKASKPLGVAYDGTLHVSEDIASTYTVAKRMLVGRI